MSVKCLTVVLDDDGRDLCVLSVGINGQLTGHGQELKQVLRGYAIVHDLGVKDRSNTAVSMGHLAVILIKRLRPITGPLEMLPAGTRGAGEEYVYAIYPRHTSPKLLSLLNLRIEAALSLKSGAAKTVIYDGLLDEFDPIAVQAEWSHPAPRHKTNTTPEAAKAAKAN